MSVTALWVTPVKGTRLQAVARVQLDRAGAVGNRRFFLVDARERMVNGKSLGLLQQVVASVDDGSLALELPGGEVVSGPVALGEPLRARFFSRMMGGHVVEGPFGAALSELCGQPLRLVQGERTAVDRGAGAGVSLISRGSLARLAAEAGADAVDGRRFRMLVEVDGIGAHEEDAWVGRRVRVGTAEVRFDGHVGRCLVTNRDPDTGESDFPTLDTLLDYRHGLDTTEPVAFGVYGAVVAPGEVAVGDAVELLR